MDHSPARENILKKIREALETPSARPSPESKEATFFRNNHTDLVERFCSEFAAIDGRLVMCPEEHVLLKRLAEIKDECGWDRIYCNAASLPGDFGLNGLGFVREEAPESAMAVITGCECLVARTGTIVLSSAQDYGRALTVYAPVHIVVASIGQLVEDVRDGLAMVTGKYGGNLPSAIYFASGPSRTGDIEKTLVKGVHGPIQVYLFLCPDPERRAVAAQSHHPSKSGCYES